MKILLDDKTTRGYNLNANEACIFAAILKCTRAGRGWYGNYRELAAAMPFVINHSTVYRAIQKLLNLGLIERRDEKLFALLQNETGLLHDATELLQNETELLQNALPPNNPPINNNNMNEKEKEQPRALRTHDGNEQQDSLFEKFFKKFSPLFGNRFAVTKNNWENRSEPAQQAMWYAVKDKPDGSVDKNPYFFVQDFPEPQPHFLSGVEQDNCHVACIPLVQVRYNGAYKICTRETMKTFGLEWVRDW
jgi:hypothetical protein